LTRIRRLVRLRRLVEMPPIFPVKKMTDVNYLHSATTG
jgi:hypothetical protein